MFLISDKALFRIDKATNEVFAMFPEIPVRMTSDLCKSTRGPINVKTAIHESREALPEEYQQLAAELLKRGRDLKIVKRVTAAMNKLREESAFMELPVTAYETLNRAF